MQSHIGLHQRVDQKQARRTSPEPRTSAPQPLDPVHNKTMPGKSDRTSPLVRGGSQRKARKHSKRGLIPANIDDLHDNDGDLTPVAPSPMQLLGRIIRGIVGPFEFVVLLVGVTLAVLVGVVAPVPASSSIVLSLLLFGGAAYVAFARPKSRSVRQWLPIALGGKLTRKKHWFHRLPVLTGTAVAEEGKKAKLSDPRCVTGMKLLEVNSGWARRGRLGGVGMVLDEANKTLTAVFSLVDRSTSIETADREWANKTNWNQALEAMFSSRELIQRVTLTERVVRPLPTLRVLPTERELLENPELDKRGRQVSPDEVEWPQGPTHDSFVAITLSTVGVAPSTRFGSDPHVAIVDAMLGELRAVAKGMNAFGVRVGAPLSPGELARFVRVAVDPTVEAGVPMQRQLLLSERASVVSLDDSAPIVVDENWDYVQFNNSFHRSYWVAEWPRDESKNAVAPPLAETPHPLDALQPLTGGVQLATMIYTRGGEKQNAIARLARMPLEQKDDTEAFRFTCLMTLSSPTLEHLGYQATEFENEALHGSFELRALEGRHDLGFAASLPFGRAL